MRKSGKQKRSIVRSVAGAVRIATALSVVVAAAYVLYRAHGPGRLGEPFNLDSIRYEGTTHLDTQALTELVRTTQPANLLDVDLSGVRALVQGETWVQSAAVRRKLPQALIISVIERVPVAAAFVDGRLFVVDRSGVLLDRFGRQYGSLDQPIVKGLVSTAREDAAATNARKMKVYLDVMADLKQGPRDYARDISEIDVSDPQRVAVLPSDTPVLVYLGDTAFAKRYETFLSQMDLYEELTEQYEVIEYVDVSYESKIIFHTPGGQAVPGAVNKRGS